MARLKAIDSPADVAPEHRAVAEKVVKSIPVGLLPWGVAISPN